MKTLILILSALFLTSCSNPDTSGGVTLSRGGDDANEFPYGSCDGQGVNELSGEWTRCGWISVNENNYYIMPYAKLNNAILNYADLNYAELRYAILSYAKLIDADLRDANLREAILIDADLSAANLRGVEANSRTICPNGKKWGTAGNNCGF